VAGVSYVHPELGFAIVLSDAAGVLETSPTRAIFALAGPGSEQPAIVTVAVQPIDPEWDSTRFAREALAAQAAVLGRLRVIDRQPGRIDGLAAERVVLQRQDADGRVVILDEWRVAREGRGWTVSALCPIASYSALVPLLEATSASFVAPDPAVPLPPRPAFDVDAGALTLSAAELRALTDRFEGREPEDEAARDALARLEETGVVEQGRPIEPVAALLATAAAATVKLTVQRAKVDAMAWCFEDRVTLLLRLGEDTRQLVGLTRERLPGVLADLLELGPRPTDPERVAVTTTVAELSAAFAGEGALAEFVKARLGHWRIDARLGDGRAMLEALDAPGGWWLVRPAEREVVLEPTTAGALFAHLAELAG